MKKILLLALTALAVSAAAFARDYGPRGQDRWPCRTLVRHSNSAGEELTLDGKLEWVNGRIAIKTEDKTYFVSGVQRLFGFVDGLKEGAQLTLTGRSYSVSYIPEYGFFRAEKVSFNGKDYTLNQDHPGLGDMTDQNWGKNRKGMAPPGYRVR